MVAVLAVTVVALAVSLRSTSSGAEIGIALANILGFDQPLSQGQQQRNSPVSRQSPCWRSTGRSILAARRSPPATSMPRCPDLLMHRRVVKDEFAEYTIIAIAHRRDAIADSDLLVVAGGGSGGQVWKIETERVVVGGGRDAGGFEVEGAIYMGCQI